ncbi:hypothetical protein [Enterobacter hormaechei]|uniref:hypothetical protein n=1 Tax=Enterobacter hormaechei TaxID=158836 RepID=UPI0038FC991D
MRYELKTPYRNGTTHVIFEPLDFIAKLAALRYLAASQPHTLPRRLCTEQQTPSSSNTRQAGQEARQIGRSRY